MFTEQERRIFRATVDGADRAFDPLAVRRRLAGAQRSEGLDLWGLLESHEAIADAEKAGPLPGSLRDEQYALVERLARLGCLAFDVPALQHDGAGWTQQEAAGALSAYLVWEAGLKGGIAGLALALHLYGWPPGGFGDGGARPLDYRSFVGLILNAPDVHGVDAAATFRGARAADPRNGGDAGILAALARLDNLPAGEALDADRRWRESAAPGDR